MPPISLTVMARPNVTSETWRSAAIVARNGGAKR